MVKLSMTKSWWQESMCFAARGRLQGWAAKLLRVRWGSWYYARRLDANGTAVEVGFVTSAANRPVICPVRPGNCPGSKLVWRNICKVGCD
jgi:hypothetical protein